MHESLPGQADLTYHDLAHHRVLKLVQRACLTSGFAQQVALAQLFQRLDQLGLVEQANGLESPIARAPPDDRDHFGHIAGGGGKVREAEEHRIADRTREFEVVHLPAQPLATLPAEAASVHESLERLFEEERIAACPAMDERGELARYCFSGAERL